MGIEIERKFLLRGDGWRKSAEGVLIRQGYLCGGEGVTVRVRVAGSRALLTVKGGGSGMVRQEYEYPIPLADAEAILSGLCRGALVEKHRYRVVHQGTTWEVDEFLGENRGLVLAEVELARPDQVVALPDWIGEEVTGDPRYFNAYLSRRPYSTWSETGSAGGGRQTRPA